MSRKTRLDVRTVRRILRRLESAECCGSIRPAAGDGEAAWGDHITDQEYDPR
ncbi:MAG: hypothetical protein ACJ786_25805 [Catenulispora sp.]